MARQEVSSQIFNEGLIMDYLAYFMIYLVLAFMVLPCAFSRPGSDYTEGVKVSFCVQAALLILLAFTFIISWPFYHLGWM